MSEILLGIGLFTAVVVCLALLILAARALLSPQGEVEIRINEADPLRVRAGGRLHAALEACGIPLPSACGGCGTCGLCRVRVLAGGGPVLPVERERISRRELARGERLACQVPVNEDLVLHLPAALLGVGRYTCTVRSTRQVAVLIKEIVLDLPAEATLDFRAGAFVQITSPPHDVRVRDLEVLPRYAADWARMGLTRHASVTTRPATRAYSLANHPGERGIVMLDVRLAVPPPGAPERTPSGAVSTWLFSLRPGDTVEVAGPYGHFHVEPGERELVFVGGGAGMAPMRAHVLAQLEHLRSRRRITFAYGARSKKDLFYVDTFDRLAREHDHFAWFTALSEPAPDDAWTGHVGFIHQIVHDVYLATHPAPEECLYYLCGPPLMIRATVRMLHELGIDADSIHYDDFGG